jgi:hypothetical protein
MLEGRLDSGAVPDASTNIHRPVHAYGGEIGSTDAGVFKK